MWITVAFFVVEMWSAASTVSQPSTASQAGTSSVLSSWHSPAHDYPINSSSTVDNEFDMLGTRSRSPMVMSSTACAVPSHLSLGTLTLWLLCTVNPF